MGAGLSRSGTCESNETMHKFMGLAPFQEVLRCSVGATNQHVASLLATTAQTEGSSAPVTNTSTNGEIQSPFKLAQSVAKLAAKQAVAPRIALAEIPPSVLQEPQWQVRQTET